MKKIAIGLGTSQRPKMLSQTLNSLKDLQVPEGCTVELILVDNAPHDSIEGVYQDFEPKFPFPIHYFQEHSRGIVFMRNRVVNETLQRDFDYLAFIDDDEIARKDWLVNMYNTLVSYEADVISGRTIRKLPESTPQWIKDGGFFEKGKRPTGIQRPTSSTCNVFFDVRKLCDDWDMRFDERLNFVGSSDLLFFNQAHQKGAKIIWANEAIVEEIIPESRSSQEWLLQRAYRIGNTMSMRLKIQNPLAMAYVKGVGYAISELFTSLTYKLGFKKASHPDIHYTKRMHHRNIARGILNGFFGSSLFEEYKQEHHGH